MKRANASLSSVLPLTRQVARHRLELHRLCPIQLEAATTIAAIKKTHADIRAGRLGH